MSGESNTTPRPCSSHDTVSQMKYLKPLDFYNEIFKGILKKRDYLNSRRLLGLDVSDKYVSFAVSDCKNKTAVPLRILDRQENNLSSMAADIIQSFIHQYKIVGFVVCTRETNPIDAQTQIFIEDLFKTQIFEGLKYTDYASTSKDEEFVFKQHLKFAAENLPQPPPQDMLETIMEKSYVVYALQEIFSAPTDWCINDVSIICQGVPEFYKQDGKRGWRLNIGGYCTNPSSWMLVDAKIPALESHPFA